MKFVVVLSPETEKRLYLHSIDADTGDVKTTSSMNSAWHADSIEDAQGTINYYGAQLKGSRVFRYFGSKNRGGGRGRIESI